MPIEVDGTNGVISITDAAGISGLTSMTYAVWCNLSTTGITTPMGIGAKYIGVNNREWEFDIRRDLDRIQAFVYDESANAFLGRRKTTTGVFDGNWHLIAFTFDGSGSPVVTDIKVYVDGIQIDDTSSETGTFVAMEDLGAPLEVAGAVDLGFEAEGEFAAAALWNAALTATELLSIYNAKLKRHMLQVQPSSIVECWEFNGGPDGTVADGDIVKGLCGGFDGTVDGTGSTWQADSFLSYLGGIIVPQIPTAAIPAAGNPWNYYAQQ